MNNAINENPKNKHSCRQFMPLNNTGCVRTKLLKNLKQFKFKKSIG